MSLRSCAVVIGLFVLLFLASAGGSMALAVQDGNVQEQPIMTSVSGPSGAVDNDQKVSSLTNRNLQMYEAAAGDLSLCADNKGCLDKAKEIKSWYCAAKLCDGTDNSKAPITCFKTFDNSSIEVKKQINPFICPVIKSPSTQIDKAVLPLLHISEENLVKNVAYVLALKGTAVSCEDYIKSYVGASGPKWWNHGWYLALSGCRILAHDRTRVHEENDLDTWIRVLLGSGQCSEIVNSEMRSACNAP